MATRLNRLLDEHPLWEQMVRSVTRGSETLSFDGVHLEKRPDLSIHLTAGSVKNLGQVACRRWSDRSG